MLYEYIYIYKFTITLLVVRIFSISKLHLQLHNSCHSSVTISLIYARDAFLQLIQFCVMHANKIQTRTQVAHTDALNVCAFRCKIYSTRSHTISCMPAHCRNQLKMCRRALLAREGSPHQRHVVYDLYLSNRTAFRYVQHIVRKEL